MTDHSRRHFLTRAATATAAAAVPLTAALPDRAEARAPQSALFPAGVEAAEVDANSALLVTRLAAPNTGSVSVMWTVASNPQMRAVVASGRAVALASDEWVVRAAATRLSPGTDYWFQFRALGISSAIGRLQTPPATA